MKKKATPKTRLVRIETEVVERVEKHVAVTKQSVGGFFALGADEKLKREKPKK